MGQITDASNVYIYIYMYLVMRQIDPELREMNSSLSLPIICREETVSFPVQ